MSDQDLNHASTKPRLLITRRVFPQVLESLAGHFEIEHNEADVPWDLEEMRARIAPMDALYTVATDRIDASVIAAAPRLRMIATGSVGDTSPAVSAELSGVTATGSAGTVVAESR
ncbi:MAG: hypothetical protein EB036_03210 [Betaproteobacteria bacterium]|nr:hypothetical protein [Betaproteobacteria bacterium]